MDSYEKIEIEIQNPFNYIMTCHMSLYSCYSYLESLALDNKSMAMKKKSNENGRIEKTHSELWKIRQALKVILTGKEW